MQLIQNSKLKIRNQKLISKYKFLISKRILNWYSFKNLKLKIRNLAFFAILVIFFSFAKNADASALPKPPNNLGLVGYWSLNDCSASKATDFSGNGNTGTLTNFALSGSTSNWVAGKRSCALNFDGSNDYVEVLDSTSLRPTTGLTLSAWVKTTSSSLQRIVFKGDAGNQYSLIESLSGGDGKVGLRAEGLSPVQVTSATAVNDGTWHHVVAAWNGTTTVIYIDGAVSTTASQTGTPTYNSSSVFIGNGSPANGQYFNGTMDEVRIYNRALGATEVTALYNSGATKLKTATGTGLVGYWSMDDCRASQATDFSGNGNVGTLTNFALSGATSNWLTAGKRSCALTFDGTNDYVTVPDSTSLALSGSVTVGFWLKSSQISNSVMFEKGSNAKIIFQPNTPGNGIYYWDVFNLAPDSARTGGFDGNWHHYLFTFNGSTKTLYLDGVSVHSAAASAQSSNSNVLTVGSRSGSYGFNGSLDEVRIYNRALSAAEVTALYNSGSAKINSTTAGRGITSGLVGHWTFDGQYLSSTTATDSSGNSNSGTLTNGPVPTLGKLGQALSFDGTNDYVDVGAPSTLAVTSGFSASAWVKSSNLNGRRGVVSKVATGSDYIMIETNGATFRVAAGNLSGTSTILSSGTIDTNWHHVVFNYDGTTSSLYVDGVFVTSAIVNLSPYGWNTGGVWLLGGHESGFASYYNGSLDDIRIYNRALSAAEVATLYNMGR